MTQFTFEGGDSAGLDADEFVHHGFFVEYRDSIRPTLLQLMRLHGVVDDIRNKPVVFTGSLTTAID